MKFVHNFGELFYPHKFHVHLTPKYWISLCYLQAKKTAWSAPHVTANTPINNRFANTQKQINI